jgi:dienelactone hydrolase
MEVTLGGGVHNRFADYFDLYPIDVSTNLLDWTPLITLQRTNASTDELTYTDTETETSSARYYRTVTNHRISVMLKPTGPRPVGMVTKWLTDSTRRNRFGISTNGSFMVMIWYPAESQSVKLPASWEDDALLRDPAWLGAFFDREPYFVSHAVPGVPCAIQGGPHPIVVYADGLGGFRYGAAEKAENLASHGYIVVGSDPFDDAVPAFPDGTVGSVPTPSLSAAGFADRVRDLSFILDELAKWNDSDPMFAGRCDLGHVAAMGMSWGGGVAGELARIDERCKAAIVLEGYLQNADELVSQGLQKPSLSIYADPPGAELLLFNKATHDAIWFQIRSTQHASFHDLYWRFVPESLAAGREAARTINAYTLWFLNKYLKGCTDPMPALTDYPRVINFKEK